METHSFTSRRPAANALPAFHLPPPSAAEVPSMINHSPTSSHEGGFKQSSSTNPNYYTNLSAPAPSYTIPRTSHFQDYDASSARSLTTSPGATTDGLSPGVSSVNTASSQGSQAPSMQYAAYGHVHGGWPTPSNSSYTVNSAAQAAQSSLGQQPFHGRPAMYGPTPGMTQFNHPRTSHSPATGAEGLPPPPYDGVHHTFQTSISGSGGGGQGNPSGLSSAPQPPQSAMLSSQHPVSSQPPTPSSATAHADSYTHSRPPNTPSYYTATSTPQQPTFPSYAPHPSPTQHSPTNAGPPRGLGSMPGQPQGPNMAPPHTYRHFPSYQHQQPLQGMNGSVMTNIHQPGSQLQMIPGMGVGGYGHHTMMYGHSQQPPPSERPFKCDQCVQSFSRNHDLKRHKRIHLAVKPFPCTFCSKSFSRKDALKVRIIHPRFQCHEFWNLSSCLSSLLKRT